MDMRFFLLTCALITTTSILLFSQRIETEEHSTPINITQEHSKHRCGTPPPDDATKKYIRKNIIEKEQERALQRNNVTNCLPVKVHIVRETGGTGGLGLGDLAIAFANLNYVYYEADMEFFVCGDINYIDDSDFYNFDESPGDDDDEATFVTPHEVTDAINVFFMNSITIYNSSTMTSFNAAGYAYFPFNNVQSNRIFMINSVANNAPNSTFSHELGHYFSLYHTHEGTENGNTNANAERVVRTGANANCSSNGDELCDTDADPRYSSGDFDLNNCSYTGTATDNLGVTYTPTTAINNIMSYYPDDCGGVFTAGQYTRIGSGLTDRQGHTAYGYGCSAASITAASGMTATVNGNQIDLSWTDNASNELGYIIERSTTSSSAGFLPVIYGGVADNVTSFSDTESISSNTTYWYRVRPVNSACDNYSNVATVTTSIIYCTPSYSNPCTGSNSILDDFSMNGDGGSNEINNQNSNCSSTSYDNFTNLIATVTPSSTYSFTACRNLSNTRYIEVWVDWNQDGDFADGDEQMINSTQSLSPCYTGSITVPASASSGNTTMRIIIANGSAPSDPCGAYGFGEAEDYTLAVSASLPIELISFDAGQRDESVFLNWQTATETNNDFFTIERSSDGIQFEEIAFVEGAGNSTSSIAYDYLDLAPLEGINYYRLKQTDFDKKFSYSEIKVVEFKSGKEVNLQVIPNPVSKNEFNIIYHSAYQGDTQFRILDMTGKILKEEKRNVEAGKNNLNMGISNLNAGIYFLQTQQRSNHQMIRFVKL